MDEFCDQLGPYLGKGLSRKEVSQLFLKIDANARGAVAWDEFSVWPSLHCARRLYGRALRLICVQGGTTALSLPCCAMAATKCKTCERSARCCGVR